MALFLEAHGKPRLQQLQRAPAHPISPARGIVGKREECYLHSGSERE